MADKHETIKDIRKDAEAKFRELVDAWMQRRSTFQTTLGAMQAFNTFFDRLEAAHKRERGDVAKLRDALEYMFILIDERHLVLECETTEEISGVQGKLAEARAALSAQPRNCDVYSADELKAIFKSELVSELPIANEHEKNIAKITAFGVIDTLLAPATEQEGGNDADK